MRTSHYTSVYILRVYLPLGKGPALCSLLSPLLSRLGPVSWSKEQRSVGLGVPPLVLVNSRSSWKSSRGGDSLLPFCPSPMPSFSRWRLLSRPIRMHFQAPVTCWSYCYKKTLALAQAPQPQAPWALAWALGLVQDPMKGEAPQPASPVSNAVWYFPEMGGGKPHPS